MKIEYIGRLLRNPDIKLAFKVIALIIVVWLMIIGMNHYPIIYIFGGAR